MNGKGLMETLKSQKAKNPDWDHVLSTMMDMLENDDVNVMTMVESWSYLAFLMAKGRHPPSRIEWSSDGERVIITRRTVSVIIGPMGPIAYGIQIDKPPE